MIITCPKCSTSLQLDDAKVPARPFSVRCPKCEELINAQPQPVEPQKSAVAAVVGQPAPARAQQGTGGAAPTPDFAADAVVAQPAPALDSADMARVLVELLRRGGEERTDARGVLRKPSWERRRALVCVGSTCCKEIARALTENNYEVFVAEKLLQALELLRNEGVDVIVLDAEFDAAGQGAGLLSREINSMRMAERRRLVFVSLSATLRTGDAHAAFLSNVNLVVNISDTPGLPRLLEKNIRDLNELYRDFNRALNVAEL